MTDRPELQKESSEKLQTEELLMPDLLTKDKKDTIKYFLPAYIAEIVMSAIMVGVYVVIGKCSSKVILGALLGTVAELLNFLVMMLSVMKAEKAESPERGQLQVRGRYVTRMVVLLVVLALALKSGYFAPIPTLLPLCFMRIALFASQLGYKKQYNKKKGEKS